MPRSAEGPGIRVIIFTGAFLLIVGLRNCSTTSQGASWQRTYGGIMDDTAYAIVECEDGGFVVAGETWSFGTLAGDVFVMKVDDEGNVLWDGTYCRGGNSREWARSVVAASNGGYALAGFAFNLSGSGGGDVYLLRIDQWGNKIWDRTYGGVSWDEAFDIVECDDGGYLVAGLTASFGAGRDDIYLIRIDAQGNRIWEKAYGGPYEDRAYRIIKTVDGRFIIVGEKSFCTRQDQISSTTADPYSNTGVYVLMIDEKGTEIWDGIYRTALRPRGTDILQMKDGSFMVVGQLHYSNGDAVYLLRIDAHGQLLSERTHGVGYKAVYKAVEVGEGELVLAGGTGLSWGDIDVFKVDSGGDLLWRRTYGGNGGDEAYDIVRTLDGGFIVAGRTNSFGAGGYDAFLLKIQDEQPSQGDAGTKETAYLGLKWVINTSRMLPGKYFGAGHQGCQTIWDVDQDGVNEIIFGTRRGDSGRLWCFDAKAHLRWIYPRIYEDGLPSDPTGKVSLIDVDKDGGYELAFVGGGGRLHVLKGDGGALWTWDSPAGSAMNGAPQAQDVDNDGDLELFLTDNAGYVYCLTHGGELIWRSPQGPGSNLGHVTVCDLDQDGKLDVLWANNKRRVFCADAQTGEEKWHFDTLSTMKYQPVIVADINTDGQYEAIIWTDAPGELICLSWYGEELWKWVLPMSGSIRNCQAMGDVDADGTMDMVVNSDIGQYVLDIGGTSPTVKWANNITDLALKGVVPAGGVNNAWSSYQLIADIDGDDKLEILWLLPYPIVTDAATGAIEAYYLNEDLALGARQENGGWWGDVDRDGKSEWIVELNGKSHPQTMVYCLTMGGKFPANSPWPEYYHCAYPAEYQNKQDWLTLKSECSNSLWFPMHEAILAMIMLLTGVASTSRGNRWTR